MQKLINPTLNDVQGTFPNIHMQLCVCMRKQNDAVFNLRSNMLWTYDWIAKLMKLSIFTLLLIKY